MKNNIFASGDLLEERCLDSVSTLLTVNINNDDNIALPVMTLVDLKEWEKFKKAFPSDYKSLTVHGQIKKNASNHQFFIEANGICCFHNLLEMEAESEFSGIVRLKKKFNFDTSSRLYLKRMVFETLPYLNGSPVSFEATALRGIAPYFDEIKEGDIMYLKANYVTDSNGNPPYWRVRHKPEVIKT